jgi:hypothetical protein
MEALPGVGIPCLVGYSTEMLGEYGAGPHPASEILPFVRPRKERAVSWAEDIVTRERVQEEMAKRTEEISWGALRQALEWARGEGRDRLLAKENEIYVRLPDISKETLLEKIDGTDTDERNDS